MNNDRKALRSAIRTAVRKTSGRIANEYVTALVKDFPAYEGGKQGIRREIETMILDGDLVTKTVEGRKSKLTNVYLPDKYTLGGIAMSVRQLVANERNVHGLSRCAITYRLDQGMTPEEALAAPRSKAKGDVQVAAYSPWTEADLRCLIDCI